MRKQGLSLMSIVVYVSLFFAFMTFATVMATNMNYTSLSYKGEIINAENFQKLQYNILNSAKNSTSVDSITDSIIFSNNDEYTYDLGKRAILKNGLKLISDVVSFEIISIDDITGIPDSLIVKENGEYINFDESKNYICINITLKKYGVETTSQIFVTVGDENIE